MKVRQTIRWAADTAVETLVRKARKSIRLNLLVDLGCVAACPLALAVYCVKLGLGSRRSEG